MTSLETLVDVVTRVEARSPWDAARRLKLYRGNPTNERHQWLLDPGVNFFVLALEAMDIETVWSCEGHPDGFYIIFNTSYEMADNIHSVGYFDVSISRVGQWRLWIGREVNDRSRRRVLRYASEAWWDKFILPLAAEKSLLPW